MNNKIVAIIPARGGSKGVPDKNIRALKGIPLIAYSIVAAKQCPLIDRVIVSTDSQKIADFARGCGAEVPFLRPSAISQDFSSDLAFMVHAAQFLKTSGGGVPKYFVHLRPTTPLRHADLISQAIKAMEASPNASSLRSAHECPESPFKWFTADGDSFWRPIVNSMPITDCNLPRQHFPKVFVPNGYVDVAKPDYFLASGDLYGPRILKFVTPLANEIDTTDDFLRLEYEVDSFMSPLMEELLRLGQDLQC